MRWPALFVMCTIHRFRIGILILVYVRLRCGFARRRTRIEPLDLPGVLLLRCCVAGFVLVPVQADLIWNVSVHVRAIVSTLSFMLMGSGLCGPVGGIMRRKRAMVAAASPVLNDGIR